MKSINELKIEDSSLRMQLESGEERLSSLKRLVETEKLKLRDDDAELAVAEARTAEVTIVCTCLWSLDGMFDQIRVSVGVFLSYVENTSSCMTFERGLTT